MTPQSELPEWIQKILNRPHTESVADISKSRGDLLCALSIACEALSRIDGMHGENECGMCGSYDASRDALRRIEKLGEA
jgi:hypothetical protein